MAPRRASPNDHPSSSARGRALNKALKEFRPGALFDKLVQCPATQSKSIPNIKQPRNGADPRRTAVADPGGRTLRSFTCPTIERSVRCRAPVRCRRVPAARQSAARDHVAKVPEIDAAALVRPARDVRLPYDARPSSRGALSRITLLSLPSAPATRMVMERPAQISLPVINLLRRMISRR